MIRLLALALAAITIITTPATAQIRERDIERGRTTIEADRGYIYLETDGRFFGIFLRVPEPEDYVAYEQAREDQFAELQEQYARDYAAFERAYANARERRWRLPTAPEEPTMADVSVTPPELQDAASFGPGSDFAHDDDTDRRAYLTVVRPGTYVWYGPVMYDTNQGFVGACNCMGTVMFDVVPGVVTDLGDFLTAAPRYADRGGAQMEEFGNFSVVGLLGSRTVSLPTQSREPSFGLPESLAAWAGEPVEFRAAGKMNNFYGTLVDRLPPIDGVLEYRRDQVIDARTGEVLETLTLPQNSTPSEAEL
ncbi:hypothetical protein [Aurantiacibacter gilvus]|uniref:Uncharacterized protein n=1 Tax=Aurantiacibacter gilvus TaxID=3139141 RepID=A0ABU9IAJ9_9SPHN